MPPPTITAYNRRGIQPLGSASPSPRNASCQRHLVPRTAGRRRSCSAAAPGPAPGWPAWSCSTTAVCAPSPACHARLIIALALRRGAGALDDRHRHACLHRQHRLRRDHLVGTQRVQNRIVVEPTGLMQGSCLGERGLRIDVVLRHAVRASRPVPAPRLPRSTPARRASFGRPSDPGRCVPASASSRCPVTISDNIRWARGDRCERPHQRLLPVDILLRLRGQRVQRRFRGSARS